MGNNAGRDFVDTCGFMVVVSTGYGICCHFDAVRMVQVVVAQRHGLHVAARIVTPRSPHREGLLPDAGHT